MSSSLSITQRFTIIALHIRLKIKEKMNFSFEHVVTVVEFLTSTDKVLFNHIPSQNIFR